MPILSLDVVEDESAPLPSDAAQRIADAAGQVLGTPAGRTWVLIRPVPAQAYAENQSPKAPAPLLVSLRMREVPSGQAREQQVQALTQAIARAAGRPAEQVHLVYEAPALGRQAYEARSSDIALGSAGVVEECQPVKQLRLRFCEISGPKKRTQGGPRLRNRPPGSLDRLPPGMLP